MWIHSGIWSKAGLGDLEGGFPPLMIHYSMVWQIYALLLTPLGGVVGQGQRRPLSCIPTSPGKDSFAQKKTLIVNPGTISPEHFEGLGPNTVLTFFFKLSKHGNLLLWILSLLHLRFLKCWTTALWVCSYFHAIACWISLSKSKKTRLDTCSWTEVTTTTCSTMQTALKPSTLQ